MKKFSQLTGAQWTAMKIAGSKLLVVDAGIGSDSGVSMGLRGVVLRAFATLAAAKNAAQSGDTIIVYPGNYVGNDLLKNGVNWHFMPGARVDYVDPGTGSGYGIFDDRPTGAVNCRISGNGYFTWSSPLTGSDLDPTKPNQLPANGTSYRGLFVMTQAASSINFQCDTVSFYNITGTAATTSAAFYLANGTADITFVNCIDPNFNVPVLIGQEDEVDVFVDSTANGIFWEVGEHYIHCSIIRVNNYGVWPSAPLNFNSSANLWLTADLIENHANGASAIYLSDGGSLTDNWRTWIIAKEIRANDTAFAGVSYYARGRHYLFAEKVSSAANGDGIVVFSGGGGSIWINVQKVSAPVTRKCLSLQTGNTAIVHAEILELEEGAQGIAIGAGTLHFRGLTCAQSNGKGIVHSGGVAHIRGLRVNTSATNNAANRPVEVSSAGLILDGCTLIAPAAADSIFAGSAQTVKVYGTTFANKAKNASVTIQAGLGTLIADSNVT